MGDNTVKGASPTLLAYWHFNPVESSQNDTSITHLDAAKTGPLYHSTCSM